MVERAHTRRKRERVRNEILEAAREVVLERGLAAFTLDDVASRLGLTKAALYYYFRSKDELAFELYLDEWTRAAEEVHDAVADTDDGAGALEALVKTYFDHYRDRPELFLLTHAEIARADNPRLVGPEQLERIRPLNERFYGEVEAKLQADRSAGRTEGPENPRRLAFVAHLATIGLLTFKTMVEAVGDPLRFSDDELVAQITALLRSALQTNPGERP